MAAGVNISADLTAFNASLKSMDKEFASGWKKRMRVGVAEAGSDLVSAIRSEASWSKRIPAATSIASTFGAKKSSVRIRVDKNKAPHARGLEFGNSDSFSEKVINANGGYETVSWADKKSGKEKSRRVAVNRNVYKAIRKSGSGTTRTLRHPVWKNGGYASQPTRPFFFAAIQARTPAVEKKFQTVIAQIAADAGFKGV